MDSRTLNAFRRRDESAVRAMYREYGNLVYAVAHHALGRHDLAREAVCNKTFVNAWLGRRPVRRSEPRSCTVARDDRSARRHRISTVAKRVDRPLAVTRFHRVPSDSPPVTSTEPPEGGLAWCEPRSRRCTSNEATIVRLQHLAGMTHTEISEKLGVGVGERYEVEILTGPIGPLAAGCWGISGSGRMTERLTNEAARSTHHERRRRRAHGRRGRRHRGCSTRVLRARRRRGRSRAPGSKTRSRRAR